MLDYLAETDRVRAYSLTLILNGAGTWPSSLFAMRDTIRRSICSWRRSSTQLLNAPESAELSMRFRILAPAALCVRFSACLRLILLAGRLERN